MGQAKLKSGRQSEVHSARVRTVLIPMSSPDEAESLTGRILLDLTRRLEEDHNGLVQDGVLDELFAQNTTSIIAETLSSLDDRGTSSIDFVSVNYGLEPRLGLTGRTRASQSRHPAESLMAAEIVFGVALPLIAEQMDPNFVSTTSALRVAQALHHAIWRRFPPGAIAYVEYILGKMTSADQDSRKQVARELHDRIAHGIASAIQRIELSRIAPNGMAGNEQLERAEEILQTALEDVQDIATTIRHRVGARSLAEALSAFAIDLQPGKTIVNVQSRGRERELSVSVKEEIFTMAVEAIRNARQHSGNVTKIDVELGWRTSQLELVVSDDGEGFDPTAVRATAFGLIGMQERALAINATLTISSTTAGTRIAVIVPTLLRMP